MNAAVETVYVGLGPSCLGPFDGISSSALPVSFFIFFFCCFVSEVAPSFHPETDVPSLDDQPAAVPYPLYMRRVRAVDRRFTVHGLLTPLACWAGGANLACRLEPGAAFISQAQCANAVAAETRYLSSWLTAGPGYAAWSL